MIDREQLIVECIASRGQGLSGAWGGYYRWYVPKPPSELRARVVGRKSR
jgi:hypothetical protein